MTIKTNNTYQQSNSSLRRWDMGSIKSYNLLKDKTIRSNLNWRNNYSIYRNSYKTLIGKRLCCTKSISFCLINHDDNCDIYYVY